MPNLSIPSPIKGWNTTDSIANVPPDMAIVMDNIMPSTASVAFRKGYASHATGVGAGNVDSLFELRGGSISKMIAASNGSIFDVTTAGIATSLASGFSSNQWQGTVFNAVLGLVNGTDAPQTYNGTTVAAMTVSGPTITLLNSITTFKFRSYFTVSNSQSFWYSALNTLGGALTEFPLGRAGNFGGNLIAIQAITKDGGSGQDDNLCFFMSTGEVIIYQGTSPATDFVLIGVFQSGRPLPARGIVKFGPDVLSVTNEGYVTMSSLLPLSFGKTNDAINKYIKGAASTAAATYPTSFGWQVVLSPTNNFMMVNVPQSNNTFVQHVLNVNTIAWCRFTGFNARCWATFGNDLYFGSTNGTVYKYTGTTDNGASVTGIIQTPYFKFAEGGGTIRTTAFKPWARYDSDMTLTIKYATDYKESFSTPYTITYASLGAEWGDAWGTAWSTTGTISKYLNLNSFCYALSLHLTFASPSAVDYFQTDFVVDKGSRI